MGPTSSTTLHRRAATNPAALFGLALVSVLFSISLRRIEGKGGNLLCDWKGP